MRPISERLFIVMWVLAALVSLVLAILTTSASHGDGVAFTCYLLGIAFVVSLPVLLAQYVVLGYWSVAYLFSDKSFKPYGGITKDR